MANITPRSEWSSSNRGGGSLTASRVTGITLHYPASGNVKLNGLSKSQVASRLNGWRNYHINSLGWADIGYNFAVDGSGRIWELRGHQRQGVHAGNVNPIRIGILLVVGDNEEPTEAAVNAVNELWAWLRKNHFSNIGGSVLGHGQEAGNSTACPGPKVRALIANGSFSLSNGSGAGSGTSTQPGSSKPSGSGSGSSGGAKSTTQLAREVIDGKHGSGEARKRALGSRYQEVQNEVNRILSGGSGGSSGGRKSTATLAREVIDGKHGSGAARQRSLGSRYQEVQNEVNRILSGGSGGSSGGRKSNTAVAREILAGTGGWGNEPQRSQRLRAAGYNPQAVQNIVNRLA